MYTNPTILHIGYHKTGTTFLQRKVFPFLGFENVILQPDSAYLATAKDYDPDHFLKHLKLANNDSAGLTLISQETFSGRSDGNPI